MVYQATWIFLLLTGAAALIFEQDIYQVNKLPSDYYLMAPDLFRQNSFVFATTNKTGKSPLVLRVDMVIVDWKSTYADECSLTLKANVNAESIGLSSVKRLNANKILLETWEQIKSGNRYSTLVFLDMESCKITFPLALQLLGKNIVHTRENNEFALFTADKSVCKIVGDKCLINYRGGFYTVESFKVDLVWSSVRIERTFINNLCLVHGLNGSGGYQVELYDLYNRTGKKLISLPYIEGMQIITSDLAICWILDARKSETTVYCSQFDRQGVLIFSSTITYKKTVKLIFLHSVRKGKIILLTGRQAEDSISWEISITRIERNNQPRLSNNHQINTACTRSTTEIEPQMVFDARTKNEMIEIQYLCLDNTKFRYSTISMVDK